MTDTTETFNQIMTDCLHQLDALTDSDFSQPHELLAAVRQLLFDLLSSPRRWISWK